MCVNKYYVFNYFNSVSWDHQLLLIRFYISVVSVPLILFYHQAISLLLRSLLVINPCCPSYIYIEGKTPWFISLQRWLPLIVIKGRGEFLSWLRIPQCYLNTPSIFIGSEINNLEEIFCSGFFPVVFYVLRLVSSVCNYSCDITSILQHPFQTVTQLSSPSPIPSPKSKSHI